MHEGELVPEFSGGEAALMKFLSQNIKYPVESRKAKRTGIVYINFIVTPEGIATPKYIHYKGVDGYLDLVVWEIIEKMPPWSPGIQDGKPVEVEYVLPVQFKLR